MSSAATRTAGSGTASTTAGTDWFHGGDTKTGTWTCVDIVYRNTTSGVQETFFNQEFK